MKPRGLVNKKITKACPHCTLHVPTASKTCSCGFVFRRSVTASPPVAMPTEPPGRRRTGRVKKEPNYFNTMEYDQHFKRKRRSASCVVEEGLKKKKIKSKPSQLSKDDESRDELASSSGDTTQSQDQDKSREEIQDAYLNITPEKGLQYAIILAEINRKFLGQNFTPS